ncbi:hypothetical protein GA565_19585 [Rouxiella sp. S1S-2]|uniref:glucosyltransferase domain-containing protein n=1 Tax=Rouxiella sp. S1S-2 TaxID=2653856 RepID=UPI0012655CD3|nr:glucosyltransferase domain-containing protein [Rouxiella sp. S1S-2]KAB7898003.1 hypothetical protein GA565_19585 [Rouxiella sp. S1S-2]
MIRLKDNSAYVFITSLVAYLFVYGFEISHFTLSVDEEYMNNSLHTLSLGRWGHTLLHMYVLPEPWLPFFSITTGIIFLALSNIFICKYLKLDLVHSVIFSILLVGMPQAAFQLEFGNQADTYGISVFLTTVSILFFAEKSLKNSIIFVLANAFAISIYQSSIVTPITIFLLKEMFDYFRNEPEYKTSLGNSIKSLIRLLALLIASYIVYKIILILVMKAFGVSQSPYLADFIGWNLGVAHGIKFGFGSVIKYTSFIFAPYGMKHFSFVLPALLAILIIAFKRKRLEIFLCGFLALISVFAINIGIGSNLPPRTLIEAPMVFAGLITFVIFATQKRDVGIIFSVVILFFACLFSSKLFYSDYAAREADSYVAQEIVSRIHEKVDGFDETKTPVFFTGTFTPQNVWKIENSDAFGFSFFEGKRYRILNYLKVINLANFTQPPDDKVSELVAYSKSMSTWPSSGSVALTDGIVIVKLGSDNTENEDFKIDLRNR